MSDDNNRITGSGTERARSATGTRVRNKTVMLNSDLTGSVRARLGGGAIVRLGPSRGIVGFCTRRCAVTASRNGSGRTAAGQVREEDRQGARAVVVGGIRRQGSAAPLEHGLLVPHASAAWDGLIEQCRIRTCSACLCVRVCVRVCAIDAHGLDH